MELRGFEPLTPTLPVLGGRSDQARYACFRAGVAVGVGATVVSVVVRFVVGEPSGRRAPEVPKVRIQALPTECGPSVGATGCQCFGVS